MTKFAVLVGENKDTPGRKPLLHHKNGQEAEPINSRHTKLAEFPKINVCLVFLGVFYSILSCNFTRKEVGLSLVKVLCC